MQTATPDETATRLESVLAPHPWLWRTQPFRHLVASDVFTPSVYEEIEQAFREFLERGPGDVSDPQQRSNHFTRNMTGYDAFGLHFTADVPPAFAVFVSRAWHDLFAGLFSVPATGDINIGLHHHAIGSANGRVHNDLNPAWFVDNQNAEGINVWDGRLNSYTTGQTFGENVAARETVRSVAILFYLCNPPWTPGVGGETGLYHGRYDPVERPIATVAPVNNSLLAFECTPTSWHSFLSNRQYPRNSLMMWLHCPKETALARWGDESLVYWSQ